MKYGIGDLIQFRVPQFPYLQCLEGAIYKMQNGFIFLICPLYDSFYKQSDYRGQITLYEIEVIKRAEEAIPFGSSGRCNKGDWGKIRKGNWQPYSREKLYEYHYGQIVAAYGGEVAIRNNHGLYSIGCASSFINSDKNQIMKILVG